MGIERYVPLRLKPLPSFKSLLAEGLAHDSKLRAIDNIAIDKDQQFVLADRPGGLAHQIEIADVGSSGKARGVFGDLLAIREIPAANDDGAFASVVAMDNAMNRVRWGKNMGRVTW
jgi:hypothetical protein